MSAGSGRDAGEPDRRLAWLVVIAATVVAAALRLPFLGHQSLWLDEIFTRDILGAHSLPGLWDHVSSTESTPPLYYLISWLLGGRSAAAMRIVPAISLIAAVPIAYLAFRRLAGERAALASAAILAVSPIFVEYSTDARAYGLLVLCSLLSIWAFSAVLDSPSRTAYALWGLASVACVWTHYFGGFLVAGEIAVLLVVRPASRPATIRWTLAIVVLVSVLVPLALDQNGSERAQFIAGVSLGSRVSDSVRQFAMGANVPRTWLEVGGLAVWGVAVALGTLLAIRSPDRRRVLLALAIVAFGVPLLLAVLGIEDRFYTRNVIVAAPLAAVLAAPALLRARGVPLGLYLMLATLTSVWVATNWRYEQTDWRSALARAEAIDPAAPVLAVTASSAPVVQTYLGRGPASPAGVLARHAWVVVEPIRASGSRSLVPAAVPAIPGFTVRRSLTVHAFRLRLLGAKGPKQIAAVPGSTLFPGR